jgi:hypothetical protein
MFTITKIFVASLALGAVQALPQRLGARQDMIASSTSAAPAAPSSTPVDFGGLLTAPTAIKRFQQLLTQGEGDDRELINAKDLRKMTVFTFDNKTVPPKNSLGGVAVAAVSLIIPLSHKCCIDTSSRTSKHSLSLPALVSAPLSASLSPAASTLLTCIHGPPSSSPWSKVTILNLATF